MISNYASMYLNIKLCMISITTYSDTDSIRIGFISEIEYHGKYRIIFVNLQDMRATHKSLNVKKKVKYIRWCTAHYICQSAYYSF